MKERSGHGTIGITHDGTSEGRLMGIVTGRDYRITRDNPDTKVKDFMTPFEKLVTGEFGISIGDANDIIWDNKLTADEIRNINNDYNFKGYKIDGGYSGSSIELYRYSY